MYHLTRNLYKMRTDLLSSVSVLGICLLSVGRALDLRPAVRRSRPGLESPPKLWWAKEITPDFYVSGRPTERQIKYAYEGGFKSIFSLFVYDTAGDHGGEYLPNTAEAAELASSLGLGYKSLIENQGDFWKIETVQAFTNAIQDLPRPILLHCNRAYTISYVTLMYMANKTRHDTEFEPKIYSNDFYRTTAFMGLDFTADHLRETVSAITGEPVVSDPPRPDAIPSNWRNWWLAHPITKHWFAAGQLRKSDVNVLANAGFKAIVNLRMGISDKTMLSQEQVTLLNVIDGTSTVHLHNPPRQSKPMLEKSLINPNLEPSYIGPDSEVNYEKMNEDEFGDGIGQNEHLESEYARSMGMKYYHVPTRLQGDVNLEEMEEALDVLEEAGENGPVVVHCRDVTRAAYMGVLAAALQEDLSREWGLNKLVELGFPANTTEKGGVFSIYSHFLPSRTVDPDTGEQKKDEL